MIELENISKEAEESIIAATDLSMLDDLRVEYLGKKGRLTGLLKGLGSLSAEERPAAGAKINEVKQSLQGLLNERKSYFEGVVLDAKLAEETIDVSLPGRVEDIGGLHPVTRTMERIESFFSRVGYDIEIGPEIEDDYHNFEALNIPITSPRSGDARYFLHRPNNRSSHAYISSSSAHDGEGCSSYSYYLPWPSVSL